MDSDGSRWFEIFLIILFMLLKGFFAAYEASVAEFGGARAKALAGKTEKEQRLYALLQKPDKIRSTLASHRILSSVALASLSVLAFLRPLQSLLLRLLAGDISPVPDSLLHTAAVLAVIPLVLLTTGIVAVFCEGVPKRLVSSGGRMAVACVGALQVLMVLLAPLSALLRLGTNRTGGLSGISSHGHKGSITEEDILFMVDEGNQTGLIEESQREMINNVFEFSDLRISDVMTHRTEMVAADSDMKISDVVYMAIRTGRSRIPVYEDDIDRIIGVVYVKDLLCLVGCEKTDDFSIRDFLRDIPFVPEAGRCGDVLKKLIGTRMQLAVAVDEYGGTAGIVSMEDLVEAIVGSIQDEYDNEQEEFVQISEGVYSISGSADPDTVLDKLGLPQPGDHSRDTMSGFIVDLLGYIPGKDQFPSVIYQGVEFTVLLTKDRRVAKIKAVLPRSVRTEDSIEPYID